MSDTNLEQIDKHEKCCENCRYYESRSGFCRYNPPTSLVLTNSHGSYVTSVFSKINMPNIDWCQKFEKAVSCDYTE